MNLSNLLPLADGWETLTQAEESLRRGRRAVLIEGTPLAAKGLFLAHVARELARPLLLITYTDEQAARLAEDLGRLLPERSVVRTLPSSLPLLLDDAESARDIGRAGRRMATLTALANGDPTTAVVTTGTALLQEVPPPAAIKSRRLVLTSGESVNVDQIAARLNAFGYAREDQVNLPGSFARRGDILDVFPSDGEMPVRIDLFGDDIESIRPFDRETQRSEGKIDAITLVAAHEVFFHARIDRQSQRRPAGATYEATCRDAGGGRDRGAAGPPARERRPPTLRASDRRRTSPASSATCPTCTPTPSARSIICPPTPIVVPGRTSADGVARRAGMSSRC